MARFRVASLLLLTIIRTSCLMTEPVLARTSRTSQSGSRTYILAACRRARYPALCFQYLSGLASSGTTIQTPQQVAQAALAVALYRALRTKEYMMKVSKELPRDHDYQAVQDCTNQLTNGVYQMSQSIAELHRLGRRPVAGKDFYFHMSNVETWVSTTITDAMMCVEQFSGRRMGKVKATIRGKVLNVAMTASNALYLFHTYAAKYGAVRGLHTP